MKHYHTRVAQLAEILDTYQYPLPFSEHLKQYFRTNKKAGSKDRKEIRSLAYTFFRIANAVEDKTLDNIAEIAAKYLDYEGNAIDFINDTEGISAESIFTFNDYLSEEFKNEEFQLSFLNQPSVWIKIKPGKEDEVIAELKEQDIAFNTHSSQVLSFENEAKLTDLKSFKTGLFRIQDLSSQSVSSSFKASAGENWWDSCAGSGGKSMALLEEQLDIHLYASDIRESILNNLHERFRIAGLKNTNIFAADVTQQIINQHLPEFDGIIIDAPCTGSGTWARNPENLQYFDPETIKTYQERQLAILENVFPFLKTGKALIYITCSVFKMENEDVISKFAENHQFKIEEQKYLEGYKQSAENMFLCRMIKAE